MSDDVNISNLSEDTGPGKAFPRSRDEINSRQFVLKNVSIGVSISESDDLAELGYGVAHLKDAMLEIARYIFALGGKVCYGGDIRNGGFTELLFDLLAYYKADKKVSSGQRLISFLSWPNYLELTPEIEAQLVHNVSFRKVVPVKSVEIKDLSVAIKSDSAINRFIWADCLTQMRLTMQKSCDARVFIGGRRTGFKGKYPGILEEFMLSLDSKKPTYLIGAFGGIAKDIIRALDGQDSQTFTTLAYKQDEDYKQFTVYHDSKRPDFPIDFEGLLEKIQNYGFSQLSESNGLSEAENRRLAVTPHINEMIYLILKGLSHNN